MSLNGLDDPAIKAAHDTAVSEPGGWFILKYASRDEVALLEKGNGGIVEVRNAIAAYEEASPLYAYLKYRRRNVIVKYLPEHCSRLIQARVAVHYNAVCEWFAPYDTTFSIATAKDLKDTSLSAACSLHTSSASIASSTSSLRRRRLVEIAEEEEEDQRAPKRKSLGRDDTNADASSAGPDGASLTSVPSAPPVTLDAQLANEPDSSAFAGTSNTSDSPSFLGADRPPSPAKSFDTHRLSKQISPSSDLYSYSSYYKPKVKLAPRPSADTDGRPRTSAGTGNFRPVSSIPAGFKLFSKGSRRGRDTATNFGASASGSAPSIKEESSTGATAANATIPIPETLRDGSLDLSRRPTTSSGVSVKSVATTATATTAKLNSMTPEKARLMKALKLREKKKKLSLQPPLPATAADLARTASVESDTAVQEKTSAPAEPPQNSAETLDIVSEGRHSTDSAGSTQHTKAGTADSAIDVGLSATDQASVNTQTTDSHPASPMAMASEIGDSTKASSFSESTDETAQVLNEQKLDGPNSNSDVFTSGSPGTGETKPDIAIMETNGARAEQPADPVENSRELDASKAIDPVEPVEPVETVHPITEKSDTAEEPHFQHALEPVLLSQPASEHKDANHGEQPAIEALQPTEDTSSRPLTEYHDTSPQSVVSEVPGISEVTASVEAPSTAEEIKSNDPVQEQETAADLAQSVYRSEELQASKVSEADTVLPSIEEPEVADAQSVDLESDIASVNPRRARRRAMINPIQTDLPSDKDTTNTETNLSDDDDLMDELQCATLQEAKPISVSKSPVNPVFPSLSPAKHSATCDSPGSSHSVRTVSNPIRGPLLAPGDVTTSSARSVSSGAAFLHKIAQQSSASLAPKKTAHLGSSISQRIKALEKLSGSSVPGAATDAPGKVERPSSVFYSVRKASGGRESSRSPSVAERTTTLTRDKTPTPPDSRDSTYDASKMPNRDRSGSMATRLSVFEGGNAPIGQPETIQVKARIIRDPAHPFPKGPEPNADHNEFASLDLKQSPLIVDHQKANQPLASSTSAPVEPAEAAPSKRWSIQERRMSKEKRRSQSQDRSTIGDRDREEEDGAPGRRSSLSIVRDFIKDHRGSVLGGRSTSTDNLPNLVSAGPTSKSPSRPPSVHTTTGMAQRMSISSRRSSFTKEREVSTPPVSTPLSPSLMTETSGSGDEKSSSGDQRNNAPTNKSRTSRFMRRLSSSLGSSRKTGAPTISPTVAEEEEASSPVPMSRESATAAQPTTVSYMGDVNVQFPDNLLWKRRAMCLDSQGFLVLSTNSGSDKLAGAVKRYHLSEFRLPYIPDLEVQELPNSVCLDFVDGSGLQIACEDRPGQMNILHTLQEAHQGHTTFGQ